MFQNSQAIVELSSVDGEKYVMFGLEADGNALLSDRMGAMEAIQKSTESLLDRVEDSLLKMSGMLERVVNNQQSACRPSESSSNHQAILILSEQIKLGHERQEALVVSLLDKDRQGLCVFVSLVLLTFFILITSNVLKIFLVVTQLV